jgi:hypothetical protein
MSSKLNTIFSNTVRYRRMPRRIRPIGIALANGEVVTTTYPTIGEVSEFLINQLNSLATSLLLIIIATLISIYVYRIYNSLTINSFTFSLLFTQIFLTNFPRNEIVFSALSGSIVSALIFYPQPEKHKHKGVARFLGGVVVLLVLNSVYFNLIKISENGNINFYFAIDLITAQVCGFLLTSLFTGIFRNKTIPKLLNIHFYPSTDNMILLSKHILLLLLILFTVNWINQLLYPYFFSTIQGSTRLPICSFYAVSALVILFLYKNPDNKLVSVSPYFFVKVILSGICLILAIYSTNQISITETYWITQITNVILTISFIPVYQLLDISLVREITHE